MDQVNKQMPDAELANFAVWWRDRQLKTFPKDYALERLDGWGDAYRPAAWEAWQARAALSSRPVQGGDAAKERRLSPFDAVAEAMRLASLMGGSIGMSDVEKTKHYEQRLRSHLIEFIYPPAALSSAPAREPMTEREILDLVPTLMPIGSDFELLWFARAIERHHGITKE